MVTTAPATSTGLVRSVAGEILCQNIRTVERQLAILEEERSNAQQRSRQGAHRAATLFDNLVAEWVDSGTFQDPDRDELSRDPLLLCRWLVVSAELLVGEDHVDWACVHLRDLFESASSESLLAQLKTEPELVVKAIRAFELWSVREVPQCFGLLPLLCALKELAGTAAVTKEAVIDSFNAVAAVFHKRNKLEKHAAVPHSIEIALGEAVVALLARPSSSAADCSFVVGSVLRVGVKRFPTCLEMMFRVVFTALPPARMAVFRAWLLREPAMTRRLVFAVERLSVITSASPALPVPLHGHVIASTWLTPIVFAQIASWPLRDAVVVTQLCANCLKQIPPDPNSSSSSSASSADPAVASAREVLRALLVLALRVAHFHLIDLVRRHPTMGTTDDAICANTLLQLLAHGAIPIDVVDEAALGLQTATLASPAEAVSRRYPHLQQQQQQQQQHSSQEGD